MGGKRGKIIVIREGEMATEGTGCTKERGGGEGERWLESNINRGESNEKELVEVNGNIYQMGENYDD